MLFKLDQREIDLLSKADITFSPNVDYNDEEAFALLDSIYEMENVYAQDGDTNINSLKLANEYAALADKVQKAIPE